MMSNTHKPVPFIPSIYPIILMMITIISLSTTPTQQASSADSFVFEGCSQYKYIPGSSYENNVNILLTSLVNSAMFMPYNNFTIKGTTSSHDTLYGLFQCRGDLDADECSRCVSSAVTQLGTLCTGATGGALQLEGCLVKYDNATFLGLEDKTVVVRKCGPMVGYDSDVLTKRDSVLGYIGGNDGSYKAYRVGLSGDVRAEGQCVQDLSGSECQDCLLEAIGRLKTDCGSAKWGDMFLAKCYARYSAGGDHSQYHDGNGGSNDNDNEIEKTLAILIGLIAVVALIIVFISFWGRACESAKDGK